MKKTDKKGVGGRLTIILILVLAAALVAAAIIGRVGKIGDSSVTGAPKVAKDGNEFYIESGKNTVYSALGSDIASASSSGVRVFDTSGDEVFEYSTQLVCPELASAGEFGIAYDLGGTSVIAFDSGGLISSFRTEHEIISCSVSSEGFFAVTTGMTSYKTAVTVYDSKWQAVYRWSTGDGYLLSTSLLDSGETITGCVICDEGSKIVSYDLDSELEDSSCVLEGETALDVKTVNKNTSLVLTRSALYRISYGEADIIYDFEGRTLSASSFYGDGFTVLALLDYSVSSAGRIVTVSDSGQILGELETDRRVSSLSVSGDRIAVLWNDELAVYTRSLDEYRVYDVPAEMSEAVMLGNGCVSALSASYSIVKDTGR